LQAWYDAFVFAPHCVVRLKQFYKQKEKGIEVGAGIFLNEIALNKFFYHRF
jgi:hypothetical protein